jgi:CDP-glycerol glycerophosphotransferase
MMRPAGHSPLRIRLREAGDALLEFGAALASHVISFPWTLCVARNRSLWLVVGREHGKYVDNAKHFFWRVHEAPPRGVRVCFLTEDRLLTAKLCEMGACAVRYPRPGALWALLRAGTIVVDTMDFPQHGRVGLLRGARMIQLWHGAPLKEIELPIHTTRLARLSSLKQMVLRLHKAVTRRYFRYDLLISTSRYFSNAVFGTAFRADRVAETGYPRNDAMLDARTTARPLAMLNVDSAALTRMHEHRAGGGRTVAYAPTFRKDRHSPFDTGRVNLERISAFCQQHRLLLVLKLHPLMQGRYSVDSLDSIIDVSAESDIYPLLREVDILITDYSSIYFDYLLLDRPVIFYPYDLLSYVADDRNLLFDYEAMTPGPKAFDFESLLSTLSGILQDEKDEWKADRRRVLDLAFDDHDCFSTQRILDVLTGSEGRSVTTVGN